MDFAVYSQDKMRYVAQNFATLYLGIPQTHMENLSNPIPPIKNKWNFLFYLNGDEDLSIVSERLKELRKNKRIANKVVFYFLRVTPENLIEWVHLIEHYLPKHGGIYFKPGDVAKTFDLYAPGRNIDLSILRNSLGLTQKQTALAVGVTERTIQNWEKRSPSPQAERRLLDLIELNQALHDYIQTSQIKHWLNTTNDAFGGVTPLDLMLEGRTRDVLVQFRKMQMGEPV